MEVRQATPNDMKDIAIEKARQAGLVAGPTVDRIKQLGNLVTRVRPALFDGENFVSTELTRSGPKETLTPPAEAANLISNALTNVTNEYQKLRIRAGPVPGVLPAAQEAVRKELAPILKTLGDNLNKLQSKGMDAGIVTLIQEQLKNLKELTGISTPFLK